LPAPGELAALASGLDRVDERPAWASEKDARVVPYGRLGRLDLSLIELHAEDASGIVATHAFAGRDDPLPSRSRSPAARDLVARRLISGPMHTFKAKRSRGKILGVRITVMHARRSKIRS